MKPLRTILLLSLLPFHLPAQEAAQTQPPAETAKPEAQKAEEATTAAPTPASPQEMIQRLFDPQATEQDLLENIKKAGMAGIPRQSIIEAKLVWGLRNQNIPWLTKVIPELEVVAQNFDRTQSAGFKSADEIRSFIAYAKALEAHSKGDQAVFKTQILEALWLSPSQAPLYLQAIEKQKIQEKMANVKVDMDLVITTHDGQATTFKDVLGDKKALLVDFWASWCAPCIQLMPEVKKKAEMLSKHGIVVAGMNKDDKDAQVIAAKMKDNMGIEFPWLIEPAERPFTTQLELETIPRMVLIAPTGQVLFNGYPDDPALWVALKKVDASIQAP
ncbi:Thioredoxin [Prosthecobacter debontii]|uniref:Thioredoxin n=1 Tax=Prosthecobacter debontii TaxID=48467 RepID=A0A1T4YUH3_9BACT|nr:TlpA disulfide reductase family protein [Prosthecobacter debontii]SKB04921.1 Thioredoxin [Prosthecobacter debontii]